MDIVEKAQSLCCFEELLANATLFDLVGSEICVRHMTVLAPVDAAFTAIASTLNTLTDAQKTNIILGHVITGAGVLSGSLSDGQVVTTAANTQLTVAISNGVVTFTAENGGTVATVSTADVAASNGVIH